MTTADTVGEIPVKNTLSPSLLNLLSTEETGEECLTFISFLSFNPLLAPFYPLTLSKNGVICPLVE